MPAPLAAILVENDMVLAGAPVYLGRDMRASSPEIAAQCAERADCRRAGAGRVRRAANACPGAARHGPGRGRADDHRRRTSPTTATGSSSIAPTARSTRTTKPGFRGSLRSSCGASWPVQPSCADDSALAAAAFIARYRGFTPDGLFSGLAHRALRAQLGCKRRFSRDPRRGGRRNRPARKIRHLHSCRYRSRVGGNQNAGDGLGPFPFARRSGLHRWRRRPSAGGRRDRRGDPR